MVGIDWVAVGVLAVAWAFSNVRSVPVWIRHGVLALAFFGIAGFRLARGAQGVNMVFVIVAVIFGISYAVQAMRAPRG